MQSALTLPSGNSKTGPIAVSTTARESCPPTCPLHDNGCYGEDYRTRLHWDRVSRQERGTTYEHFVRQVQALPSYTMLRHNVTGDLIHRSGAVVTSALLALAAASRHLAAAWTFTHHLRTPANRAAFQAAAAAGLVVNCSTESRSEAARLHNSGMPAVCVVPPDAPAVFHHDGVRFVVCPASRKGSDIQCINCGGRYGKPLCAQANRPFVITFPAHGQHKELAAAACQ